MDKLKANKPKEELCYDCQTATASIFCHTCNQAYCGPCELVAHPALSRTMQAHQRIDLSIRSIAPQAMCTVHKKPIELYCTTCQSLICMMCQFTNTHRNHDISLAADVAHSVRGTIEERLTSVEDLERRLRNTADQVAAQIFTVEEHTVESIKAVKEKFDELTQKLLNREEFLISEIATIQHQKKANLIDQREALASALARVSVAGTEAHQILASDDIAVLENQTVGTVDVDPSLANQDTDLDGPSFQLVHDRPLANLIAEFGFVVR